jgi:nucleoside-diphosphate kinase
MQRTLSIIKPDGMRRELQSDIFRMIEESGLRIIEPRIVHWTREQAENFYIEHKERAFFDDLCNYMSSGPISIQILEGENAIAVYRELMGATDPKKAAPGTIRARFGISIDENTVHGSDSEASAEIEIQKAI